MRVDELKQLCRDKIASGGTCVILVTKSCRLCGRRGPMGELLCENSNGERVVRFDAAKVLKFIEREESKEPQHG